MRKSFAQLFVCGLATDFCVAWSALDARAWTDLRAAGVKRVKSEALLR